MRLFRRRPLRPEPELRTDGIGGRWVNESTGRGGPMDRHASTDYVRPVDLPSTTVDALAEYNPIGRRIIWREPLDALRPGFRLLWDGLDPAVEQQTYRWLRRRFDLLSKVKEARAFARATGGAGIILICADGREHHEPLDITGLRRVTRLVVKDRYELWPDGQIDYDLESPYYGTSRHYLVQGSTRLLRIHASRVVRFDGLPTSDRSRQMRNGWGSSVFDLIYAELRNYGSSHEDAAEAITLLTQGIFEVDGYAAAVSAGDADFVARRYAAMRAGLGTLGDIVLDKKTEGYRIESRSFAGIEGILKAHGDALIMATDMPEVILRGNRSAGLNGGKGGDDVRGWYDFVGSERTDHYETPLMELLGVCLAEPDSPIGGVVPADLGIEWPAMWQLGEDEAASLRVARSSARANDIAAGVITSLEARTDSDLAEYYELDELPPPLRPGQSLEPDEHVDDLEVEPESAIPEGETPISATSAARRLGYASAGPILGLIHAGRIRVWRLSPGSPYRVLLSEVVREAHQPLDLAAASSSESAGT